MRFRRLYIAVICGLASCCIPAFAELDSDLQIGMLVGSGRESYHQGNTDFTISSKTVGIEFANYNFINYGWFGFFEDVDWQFYRTGSAKGSGGRSSDLDDKRYSYSNVLLGPAFRIKNFENMETRIGVGLHYGIQKYTAADDFVYHDTNLGIGAVVDAKLFTYSRFSLVLGAKAIFDFNNSKSWEKDGYSYTADKNGYKNISVLPHVMLCINLD